MNRTKEQHKADREQEYKAATDERRAKMIELIEEEGGPSPFARRFGVNLRAAQDWARGARVPQEGFPELIERAKAMESMATPAADLLKYMARTAPTKARGIRSRLSKAVKVADALAAE